MKDKILLFVIGVLVGAIISTGAFFVYTKTATTCNSNNNNNRIGMPGENPPSMQNGQSERSGEPPEKPAESNAQTNDSTQANNS